MPLYHLETWPNPVGVAEPAAQGHADAMVIPLPQDFTAHPTQTNASRHQHNCRNHRSCNYVFHKVSSREFIMRDFVRCRESWKYSLSNGESTIAQQNVKSGKPLKILSESRNTNQHYYHGTDGTLEDGRIGTLFFSVGAFSPARRHTNTLPEVNRAPVPDGDRECLSKERQLPITKTVIVN